MLQSIVSPPLESVGAPLHRKLFMPLNFFLMSLSHALGHHSATRTKNIYPTPAPHQVQHPPNHPAHASVALRVPALDPSPPQMRVPATNAG